MSTQEYLGLISLVKTLESGAVNRKFLFATLKMALVASFGIFNSVNTVQSDGLTVVTIYFLLALIVFFCIISIVGVYANNEKLIKLINEKRHEDFNAVIALPELKKLLK